MVLAVLVPTGTPMPVVAGVVAAVVVAVEVTAVPPKLQNLNQKRRKNLVLAPRHNERKWKAETKAKLIGCAQVLNWIHEQPVLEGGYFSQLRELLQPFACTPHIYQLGKASNSQGAAKQVPLSANCIIGICKDDNTPNEMTLHIVAAETRKR